MKRIIINAKMKSMKAEMNLNGCSFKGLKRQPTQYPCNFHIIGVPTTNKERMLTQSINGRDNNQKYCNNAMGFGHNIEHDSRSNVQRFVEKPLSQNRNCNNHLQFQQSHLEVLNLLKWFFKWKYFHHFLLFTLTLSIIIGLIAYGVWLHGASVTRHRHSFNETEPMDFAQVDEVNEVNEVNEMVTDDDNIPMTVRLENTTELTTISITKPQRLLLVNSLVFNNTTSKATKPPTHSSSTEALESPSNNESISSTIGQLFKVSPTLPTLHNNTKSNRMSGNKTTIHDNNCCSTSLHFCQGVLNYDLTYPTINKQFDKVVLKDIDTLIKSNCSARAIEFLCTLLEPECRPAHIGILQPCRRLCKAILEACSLVINNIDTLITLFDCNLYPDSNDWDHCDDPTRRNNDCYETEFACADRSCIPYQWQCDRIKDCAGGEDEDGCLICPNTDDFRCRSNDKCIPEYKRCNQFIDCADRSDEEHCNEYADNSEYIDLNDKNDNLNKRIYPYVSYALPNQTNHNGNGADFIASFSDYTTETVHKTIFDLFNTSSGNSDKQDKQIIIENNSQSLGNFRDSKEIMITSGSENKLKYTKLNYTRSSDKHTTPLKRVKLEFETTTSGSDSGSQNTCASHQLRCVNGKCISVEQLCDKIIDCSDGFDELMCVYKEHQITRQPIKPPSTNKTTVTTK